MKSVFHEVPTFNLRDLDHQRLDIRVVEDGLVTVILGKNEKGTVYVIGVVERGAV